MEEKELHEWRSFVAVADAGSFSRAAETLQVNQPNVSRHVASLERRLGFQLFDRSPKGVLVTGPGRELIAHAREVIARLEALYQRAGKIGGGELGALRLGASSQTLVSFVAPLIGGFCRQHPEVDVRLGEGAADAIISGVESGQLDFGIVGGAIGAPLDSVALYPVDIQLLVPIGEALKYGSRMDVRRLEGKSILVTSRASLTRRLLDAACLECGVQLDIRLESESAEALVALVEEGYGIAVLPSTVVARASGIQRVDIHAKGRKVSANMNLVWNQDLYHSRAAVLLFEAIVHFARGQAARRAPA